MGNSVPPGAAVFEDVSMAERYELIRHIANGGMASVWCAEDKVLGRRVAVKLLAERFAHDQTAVRRFKREARTAARLSSHSHVVTIYDVGETTTPDPDEPPRAFIVMEYLAGGTVADALRCGEVSRDDAVRWLHEAAAAIDYAHSRGVLHRDIKPANLLLDRDRSVHVADFGIAQLATDDTLTYDGQLLGTASYLAPERALGRPATEASDRYSLAVAAFEMLVGERPFTDQRFAVQARQHVDAPPPSASERNPELPLELDAVIARGMAKRPADRWPTAQALADAVQEALGQPAVAPSTTQTAVLAAGAARARARRRPRRPAAAAAAAAAAAPPRTPPPPHTAPSRSPRRAPRRAIAVGALAAAGIGVAIAAGASNNSSPPRSSARAQHTVSHAAAQAPKPKAKAKAKPKPTTTQSQVNAAPASQTTAPPTAATLEAQGHGLMDAGNYTAAIPVLRKSLAASSPTSLTYAYALFDLGRSLRLSGDPRAAVPILYRRLQIHNQTGVVRSELELALRALGQQAQQHGNGGPGPGGDHGRGHGGGDGHDGGNSFATNSD
ncbi:MAG TPA: serine/threonine-protein kinase [Solirubrobacteraceae bacterium]